MKNKKLETAKQYYHYIDANQCDEIGKIISDKFIDHDAKVLLMKTKFLLDGR